MTEPKELSREELEAIRAHATNGGGLNDYNARALLAHIAALKQEADFHFHLISRQGRLLTGVVNAIRGQPGELQSWSHHDAPELAQRAMRVVRAANQVLKDTAEFGIDPGSIAGSIQHLGDMMHAYDQLVERHEPLSTPGVELPGWQETFQKAETGVPLDPIEVLICRLTPGDDDRAKDFRRMLRAALDYTAEQAKAVRT